MACLVWGGIVDDDVMLLYKTCVVVCVMVLCRCLVTFPFCLLFDYLSKIQHLLVAENMGPRDTVGELWASVSVLKGLLVVVAELRRRNRQKKGLAWIRASAVTR